MESSGSNPPLQPESATPAPPPPESRIKFVFFNERELRAGWRLIVYLVLGYLMTLLVSSLLRGRAPGAAGGLTPFVVYVSHGSLLLIVLIPAVIMARFERRSLTHYGLPLVLRTAFGKNFWLGVVWGVAWLTLLLVVLRLS